MTVNVKDFRTLVASKTPFKGNSVFAEQQGNVYVVYSYGYHWPMFAHDGKLWYENMESRPSRTTSRHHSACSPFGVNPFPATRQEMKDTSGIKFEEK